MSKRRETPNVLSDLLDGKPASQQASKPASQNTVKTSGDVEGKTKVTNYLTHETAEMIDFTHAQMRKHTRGRGRRLTKSEMVEAMIKMGIDDVEKNGANSRVFDFLS